MNDTILQAVNIQKYYGSKENLTKAVDRISFQVKKGEFLGIMGTSGSGKTTLLNCISTIDTVTGGHIYVEGRDITKLKGSELAAFRGRKLGFIFQDFNLLDTLTARENIALPLSVSGTRPAEIILADEPTGSLDSGSSRMLLNLISDLNRRLGATILMVTHDAFTASCCRRILFIKDGKLFHELRRGEDSRAEFFTKILQVVSELGGEQDDLM